MIGEGYIAVSRNTRTMNIKREKQHNDKNGRCMYGTNFTAVCNVKVAATATTTAASAASAATATSV